MARFLITLAVAFVVAALYSSTEVSGVPASRGLTIAEAQQILIGNNKPNPNCKAIGEACNISDECCTFRCLTYAHKCVS